MVSGASASVASGLTVFSAGGVGGAGGSSVEDGNIGVTGAGGNGGDVSVTAGGSFTSAYGRGADIRSIGGTGGAGPWETSSGYPNGGDGGAGGNGEATWAEITGRYQGQTVGVHVASAGGRRGGAACAWSGPGGGRGRRSWRAGEAIRHRRPTLKDPPRSGHLPRRQ